MAQISAKISEENASLLREYTVKEKKSLKRQSEVLDEALTEFFAKKQIGESKGNGKSLCSA
jgi:hypothetical protein